MDAKMTSLPLLGCKRTGAGLVSNGSAVSLCNPLNPIASLAKCRGSHAESPLKSLPALTGRENLPQEISHDSFSEDWLTCRKAPCDLTTHMSHAIRPTYFFLENSRQLLQPAPCSAKFPESWQTARISSENWGSAEQAIVFIL